MHKLKFIFTTQGNQNAIDIDGKFFWDFSLRQLW